jgi:hypothetical protein
MTTLPVNRLFRIQAFAALIACVGVLGLLFNILPRSHDFIPPELKPGMTKGEIEKVLDRPIVIQSFAQDARPPAGIQGFYVLTSKNSRIFYNLYFNNNSILIKIDRNDF